MVSSYVAEEVAVEPCIKSFTLIEYARIRSVQRCGTKYKKPCSRNPRGGTYDFIFRLSSLLFDTDTKALICNCSRQMYGTQPCVRTHTHKHMHSYHTK